MPRLLLPRSALRYFSFDFHYNFLDIVGDHGLQSVCLQLKRASFLDLAFVDVLSQDRTEIVRKS